MFSQSSKSPETTEYPSGSRDLALVQSSSHRLNLCNVGLWDSFLLVTNVIKLPIILYLDFSSSGELREQSVLTQIFLVIDH